MEFFPLYMDLKGRPCLVVGGGKVAARKAKMLIKAGARVTVIAPRITPSGTSQTRPGLARLVRRKFRPSDIDGYFLAIAATSDKAVNRMVAASAGRKGVLVNVVDDKELSDFIFGSVADLSPLIISVCTSGAAPALSKKIRLEIEKKHGAEYKALLRRHAEGRRVGKKR